MPATLLETNSNTVVFLQILRNFYKYSFLNRTSPTPASGRITNLPFQNPFVKMTTIFFLSSVDSSWKSLPASYNANAVSFTLKVFEVKSSSNERKSVSSLHSFNVIRVSTYLA